MVSQQIAESIILAVKKGDLNKFHHELQKYGGIQAKDVFDAS